MNQFFAMFSNIGIGHILWHMGDEISRLCIYSKYELYSEVVGREGVMIPFDFSNIPAV
jgi:hypothetical protein